MPTNYWLKFGNSACTFNGSGVQIATTIGQLAVSLSITGKNYNAAKTFGITVTFGSPIAYTVDGVTVQTPTATYTASMKAGDSVTLGCIPEGTTYSVTETAVSSADAAICYGNGTVTNGSGTMVAETIVSVVANFTYGATIGGRFYNVAPMPDGKIWLAENLDYKADGITIGGTDYSVPQACYYDNNEALYGANGRNCGLMYSYYGTMYLIENQATLTPGWHVPSTTEWENLSSALGDSAGTKLKASSVSWATGWGGMDNYGFCALPGGYRRNSFAFSGKNTMLASSRGLASKTLWAGLYKLSTNTDFSSDIIPLSSNISDVKANVYVRLVKD